MAKDKDKDKKKNKNGGINSTPSRTFEVGGNLPGTKATGADAYAATWAQLNAPQTGVPPPPIHTQAITGPKGTYGGSETTSTLNINPATGGLITTVSPLGTSKKLEEKIKDQKGKDNKKYSDDPVLAYQQKQADQAREDERKRKEKIEKGMGKIDAAFSGFNDAFYGQQEQTYKDYYMNQLNPEFKKARDNLTFALARAGLGTTYGTAGSTAEALKTTENEADIANKTGQVTANAASNTTKIKDQVAQQKSALVESLNLTADANQAGNAATASATQLATQAPDYNWEPDLFFGAAQGVGGLVQAAQNAQYTNVFNGGSSGSGSGVRTGGTTIR